jgi:hypothetical protein
MLEARIVEAARWLVERVIHLAFPSVAVQVVDAPPHSWHGAAAVVASTTRRCVVGICGRARFPVDWPAC